MAFNLDGGDQLLWSVRPAPLVKVNGTLSPNIVDDPKASQRLKFRCTEQHKHFERGLSSKLKSELMRSQLSQGLKFVRHNQQKRMV